MQSLSVYNKLIHSGVLAAVHMPSACEKSETSDIGYLSSLCSAAAHKQRLAGERAAEFTKGSNLHNTVWTT